jgi:hypothetical protein
MLASIRTTKVDPIFAVIKAHRHALAIYEPAAHRFNNTPPSEDPLAAVVEEEFNEAAGEMCPLHMALCDTETTTLAGRVAVRAYIKEVDAKDILEKHWTATRVQTRAIRAHLILLAHERPTITTKEIKEALKADHKLFDFCDRHKVSLEWMFGTPFCLKGLLVMTQADRRSRSFAAITGG